MNKDEVTIDELAALRLMNSSHIQAGTQFRQSPNDIFYGMPAELPISITCCIDYHFAAKIYRRKRILYRDMLLLHDDASMNRSLVAHPYNTYKVIKIKELSTDLPQYIENL